MAKHKPRPEDSDPDFLKTKADVIRRDKSTCQMCKKRRKRLEIHHIIPYSVSIHLRVNPDNLICLCKKCHKSIKNKEHHFVRMFTNIVERNSQ